MKRIIGIAAASAAVLFVLAVGWTLMDANQVPVTHLGTVSRPLAPADICASAAGSESLYAVTVRSETYCTSVQQATYGTR